MTILRCSKTYTSNPVKRELSRSYHYTFRRRWILSSGGAWVGVSRPLQSGRDMLLAHRYFLFEKTGEENRCIFTESVRMKEKADGQWLNIRFLSISISILGESLRDKAMVSRWSWSWSYDSMWRVWSDMIQRFNPEEKWIAPSFRSDENLNHSLWKLKSFQTQAANAPRRDLTKI